MVLENIPISDVGERDPEVGKRGDLGYCNTTATRVVGWAPSETLEGGSFQWLSVWYRSNGIRKAFRIDNSAFFCPSDPEGKEPDETIKKFKPFLSISCSRVDKERHQSKWKTELILALRV
jgi:hypothetical protein